LTGFSNKINFSVDPEEPIVTSGSIKMFMEDQSPPVPPMEADAKADMYDYSLGVNSPGQDRIRESLTVGGDHNFRRSIAWNTQVTEDNQRMKDLQAKLFDISQRRNRGEDISPDELAFVEKQLRPSINAPETVVEKEYGKTVISNASAPDTPLGKALQDVPPTMAALVKESSSKLLAHTTLAAKILAEYQSKYEEESILGTVADIAASSLIPGLDWYRQQNRLPGATSFLKGNNLREQVQQWYADEDLENADSSLRATVAELYAKNPTAALDFLETFAKASSNRYDMANLTSLLDLSTPLFFTKEAKILLKASASSTKQLMKATASGFSRSTLADAAQSADAALKTAQTVARSRVHDIGQPGSFREIEAETPTIFNPESITGGSYPYLSREAARRLYVYLAKNAGELLQGLVNDPIFIDRLSNATALDEARIAARESWVAQYPTLEDRIMDVRPFVSDDNAANVSGISVVFGDVGTLPFATQKAAIAALRDYGIGGARVVREGAGYAIQVQKPLDELLPVVRQNLSVGTKYADPVSFQNTYIKALRSKEYLLSRQVLEDMGVAQHGVSRMVEIIRSVSKAIGSLPTLRNDSRKALDQFLTAQRIAPSRKDPSKIGRFSPTLGEFEADWLHMHSRLPTEAETKAYYAYQQITNIDYITRNLGAFRDQYRQGIELHNFKFQIPQPDGAFGLARRLNGIEGKALQVLPEHVWSKENYLNNSGVVVMDSNPESTFEVGTVSLNKFQTRYVNRGAIEKAFPSAEWKVIQLTDAGEEALRASGVRALPDYKINYVMVREHGSSPLPLKRIPATEGGHNVYPQTGWYLKQPKISRVGSDSGDPYHMYYGDRTLFYFNTEKEAKHWAPIFEQARGLYNEWKAGGLAEGAFRTFVDDNLPVDFVGNKRFDGLFEGATAQYKPENPFLATRSGQSLFNEHKLADRYSKLHKASDSPNNLNKGRDLEFMQSKDQPLLSIRESGNTAVPTSSLTPARMVDPIGTMNRTLSSLMQGRYMDDLKVKTAEKFINDYAHLMKAPLEELRQNPLKYLFNPEWRPVVGEQIQELATAKTVQRAASEFMHVKDDDAKALGWLEEKLTQRIYGSDKPAPVSRWMLSSMTDPANFLRTLAFDSKLGFFNPTQYFKQLNAVVHVGGIEGWRNTFNGGMVGFWLMRPLLEMNGHPNMLKAAASMSTRWGWKNNDFLEAFDFLRRSGWSVVRGDSANLNNFMDDQVVTSAFGKFRSTGRMFFQEGDRQPRIIAYATAFKKWRDANPKAIFTHAVGRQLVDRASLTTSDMTSKSLSQIQQGLAGVATQFATYPMRMMEQYIGKRLTPYEKFHLFSSYAAIYGMPVSVAGVAGVWPIAQSLHAELMDRGVDLEEHQVVKFLNDGLAKSMLTMVTGTETNINEIYGPSGMTFFHDLIKGDKNYAEIALGASGSIMSDTWKVMDPFLWMIGRSGDTSENGYQFTGNEIVSLLKSISTFNQTDKMYAALNWGLYITRNGTVVDSVSGLEGVMMGFLGITPTRIVDTFIQGNTEKARKAFKDNMSQEAIKAFRRGLRKHGQEDFEGGMKEFENANMWLTTGDLNPEEIGKVVAKAFGGENQTLSLRIWHKYAAQNSPEKLKYWENFMNRRNDELGTQENGN